MTRPTSYDDVTLSGPIIRRDVNELRELLESHSWDLSDPDPVILAVQHGTEEILTALLDYGWEVDACDRQFHQSALSWSCKSGRSDLVRVLLLRGANVSLCDNTGHPAMVWAVMGRSTSHLQCLQLLIDAGADIDQGSNVTALINAAAHGSIDMVSELVRRGASVGLVRPNGSALTSAIAANRRDCVAFILEHGADPNAHLTSEAKNRTDWIGLSAIEIAERMRRQKILALLQRHNQRTAGG